MTFYYEKFISLDPIRLPQRTSWNHWQLRDVIVCPFKENKIYSIYKCNIEMYDTDSRRSNRIIKNLPFEPVSISVNKDYIVAGGQRGELAVASTRNPENIKITQIGGSINNYVCFDSSPDSDELWDTQLQGKHEDEKNRDSSEARELNQAMVPQGRQRGLSFNYNSNNIFESSGVTSRPNIFGSPERLRERYNYIVDDENTVANNNTENIDTDDLEMNDNSNIETDIEEENQTTSSRNSQMSLLTNEFDYGVNIGNQYPINNNVTSHDPRINTSILTNVSTADALYRNFRNGLRLEIDQNQQLFYNSGLPLLPASSSSVNTRFDFNGENSTAEEFSEFNMSGCGTSRMLVCNNDKTIKFVSLPALTVEYQIHFDISINHASISPDGSKMVAVGDNNQVFLFNKRGSTYEKITTLTGSSDASFSCDWNQFSTNFGVASQDGYVSVWDIRMTKKLASLQSYQQGRSRGACRNLKFTKSGCVDLLAFSEHASYINVIDSRSYNEKQSIKVSTDGNDIQITGLEFSKNSGKLYVGLEGCIMDYKVNTLLRKTFPSTQLA
ncbi:hypothetical protein BB559_003916 [Furculomyces boomerangus]|uniref:DUF2415 domain-containing protein n=1 Tax=Furculomyces boomerangus TaxID=61424 RepID=A0A2T9YHX3_9FUNG|nr:hypothetical protein BB559_003916 [Furculomyces boomerangus]